VLVVLLQIYGKITKEMTITAGFLRLEANKIDKIIPLSRLTA
jgi:hypothetical protein